ncbi:MFS transporter [Actinoplanes sp. NPDC048791]|uniref:MFS transporter n=1 Tax=Actinoplanes sp. NPDC048791 TaxID=3154623 RepID=UPI0033FE916F
MLSAYRHLFATPGAIGFSAAGFVARIPVSMTGIGIVTMIAVTRGSYALAGAAAAALALAGGVFGPVVARWIDRHGQRRVALPAAAAAILAMIAVIVCNRTNAPSWALLAAAAVCGVAPNVGAMVRTRWAAACRDQPGQLHIAYSLEAVLDELCFVVGPILSITLATVVFPEAGVLLSTLLLGAGVVALTAQRSTEPAISTGTPAGGGAVFLVTGLPVIIISMLATGVIFGSLEVVTLAFGEDRGNTVAASWALAAFAVGSAISGIVFGARRLTSALSTRFVLCLALLELTMLPLLLVGDMLTVTLALLLAGTAVAPTLATTSALIQSTVPEQRLNEGLTWMTTGLTAGVAAGSSVSGMVVDWHGPSTGYVVPLIAGAAGLLIAVLGLSQLRAKRPAMTVSTP